MLALQLAPFLVPAGKADRVCKLAAFLCRKPDVALLASGERNASTRTKEGKEIKSQTGFSELPERSVVCGGGCKVQRSPSEPQVPLTTKEVRRLIGFLWSESPVTE